MGVVVGGLGINLHTADTVILFDSDWNPQVDLQVTHVIWCGSSPVFVVLSRCAVNFHRPKTVRTVLAKRNKSMSTDSLHLLRSRKKLWSEHKRN